MICLWFFLTLSRGTQQKQGIELALYCIRPCHMQGLSTHNGDCKSKGEVTKVVFILLEMLSGVQFKWQRKKNIAKNMLFSPYNHTISYP